MNASQPLSEHRWFANQVGTIVTISVLIAHTSIALAQSRTAGTRTLTTEQQVQAAMNDAISRLKSGDVVGFIEFYAPVDELREARKGRLGQSFGRIRTLAARTDVTKRLERANTAAPKINLGGFLATFTIPETTAESTAATETQPGRTISEEPLAGYAGSLQDALEQAVADLQANRIESFINRLFPRGELGHPDVVVRRKQWTSRLQQHPQMVEQMLADLKLLLQNNDVRKATGNSASIPIKGKRVPASRGRQIQLPDRTFKFEKLDGFWRFKDSTNKLLKVQEKIVAKSPPSLSEFGASDVIIMERFGDRWRFIEF